MEVIPSFQRMKRRIEIIISTSLPVLDGVPTWNAKAG